MLGIELEATKYLLSSSIPGNPNVKRAAAKMADRVGAQFALYLNELISNVAKGDEATAEDVVKTLTDNGMEDFVSVFKKGMKSSDESEEESEPEQKKGKATRQKKCVLITCCVYVFLLFHVVPAMCML
eukprot:TRINITY_DN8710_c0_g1_i3.p2 TRINITY_DN8710_c0_g1~~TRINITY_DN8710_c0_g1_i3.p2  ORF type:complete len:128 (+),score=26.08 TRINITY_DN8710_c0_g1_i3:107-490(+)